MSYITVATLTDQTAVIIPRHTGQTMRLGTTVVTTTAEQPARIHGTGTLELSTGWWDMLTIVNGVYDGPVFDGDTPVVEVDGAPRKPEWDGTPNASSTTTTAFPATTNVTLERTIDGDTWETVIDTTEPATIIDWESVSYGDIQYRATAFTVEGAAASTILIVEARSGALWLSGGTGFGQTVRLPLDPDVEHTVERERALAAYAGREHPVAYVGEMLSRTITVSGTVTDRPFIEETASPDDLARIAQIGTTLFLFRDPDGRRVYGAIGQIRLSRQTTTGDIHSWNAFWGYQFTFTEAREA